MSAKESIVNRPFSGNTDPVTLSVVFNRLQAINQEMGITMTRTSRSPIFAEVHDFSCAICDWVPRIVAQVDGVPSHTASSMMAAKAVRQAFAGDIHPGDVFLINDPYNGGTHLADITVVKPIFIDGELMFMGINRAHHLDVGGLSPGSYSPLARELFHEGIRIPPVRIYRNDEPIRDVVDLVAINTRMPDLFWSDIRAQVASCNVAERRLVEMARKYGKELLKTILDDIQAYAEHRMRQEIAKLPDGTYEGEAILDDDGFDRTNVTIRVRVTVSGDTMDVDFEGTDPQTTGFINSPFANSCTSVYVAVLTTVSQDVPHNEGAYQPITIKAPPGCVVNPDPPAPVASATLDTACAVLEAMYMALSKAIPDRVPAAWNRWCGPAISGIDPRSGQFYVQYTFCGMGGGGAMPYADGLSYVGDGIDLGGLTAPNIESNEVEYPHITEYHEFDTDSGGAGKFRGGLGVRYKIRLLDENPVLVVFGDGQINAPFGLYGGLSGAPNRLKLNDGTPEERNLPSKGELMPAGNITYAIRSAGGGGWGYPWERPAERVRMDVLNGFVSREKAAELYGVILTADLAIDAEATRARRQELKGARQ